jgi:uncharacterized protein YdcH (DUF465 family)
MRYLLYLYVNYDKMKKMISTLHSVYQIALVKTLKNMLKRKLHGVNDKIKKYLQKKMVVGA